MQKKIGEEKRHFENWKGEKMTPGLNKYPCLALKKSFE